MIDPSQTRNVAIIGCGYVGYPLALLLADAGHTVRAVDTNPEIVEGIASGTNLSHEPGIAKLARKVHSSGRLTAHATLAPADVFIIAVSTPLDDTGRKADLSSLEEATRSVAPFLQSGNLVVVESTVPPRTTEDVVVPILNESGLRAGVDFHLAHCPERVFPGNSLEEMRSVPRVVGGINETSTKSAADFFATFVEGTITGTHVATAELVKLMENTYRDVNIALANQVGTVAATYGVDSTEAIMIANQHPRVSYLKPGIGVGGHCIPVDPWFLIEGSRDGGLIEVARHANDGRPRAVADEIAGAAQLASASTILVLGTSYKAGVRDKRNSPAMTVIELLSGDGYTVDVFDPYDPVVDTDLVAKLVKADLVAVLVEHPDLFEDLTSALNEVANAPPVMRFDR